MVKVVFVCWGNICRSLMTERVARGAVAERGLGMEADSVDILLEEMGNPIDRQATTVLREVGYFIDGYRARRVTADDLASADLVVAAERFYVGRLKQLCPDVNHALISDFSPTVPKRQGLDNPWYDPASGLCSTLADIGAAMPEILGALA